MGIDTEPGSVFTRHQQRVIRFVEKHQDIPSSFIYLDTYTGNEFDVRDLPQEYLGEDSESVHRPDREVHKRVIWRAIDDEYEFSRKGAAVWGPV